MADDIKADQFTSVQLDALTELVNIGCGRAAGSLSVMTGTQILLSVPRVKSLHHTTLAAEIRELTGDEIMAIEQEAHGAFEAHGLLIFPESAKPLLVRALVRGLLDPDSITDLSEETLIEFGNIFLNAVIGVLAEQLNARLVTSLPSLLVTNADRLVARFLEPKREILLIEVQCRLSAIEVAGYFVLLLEIGSLKAFRDALTRLATRF